MKQLLTAVLCLFLLNSLALAQTPAGFTVDMIQSMGQYGTAPYSTDWDIPEDRDFTVEMWVWIGDSISGDPSFLSNKDWGSGGNNGWNLAAKSASWDLNIADTTRNRSDWDPPSINDGYWHHVGFSLKRNGADSIIVWTNNSIEPTLVLDENTTHCFNVDEFPLVFGQDGTTNYPDQFPGRIDEVRIWHSALDWETIRNWRHRQATPDHPNFTSLIGYWKFDEGSGSSVIDETGFGNDVTLVNAPAWVESNAVLGGQDAVAQAELAGLWGGLTSNYSANMTLTIDDASALLEADHLLFGNNGLEGVTPDDVPAGVEARWQRVWYFDEVGAFDNTMVVDLDMPVTPGSRFDYVILKRQGTSGEFVEETGPQLFVSGPTNISIFFFNPDDEYYYTLGSKNLAQSPLSNIVGIEDEPANVPAAFELRQAYPNPFNPSTTIEYVLGKRSDVKLTVYNMLGQEVVKLVEAAGQAAGSYQVVWNADQAASGVYIYRLTAGDFVQQHKVILMK